METRSVGRAHLKIGMSAPPKAELFLNLLDLRPKKSDVSGKISRLRRGTLAKKFIIFRLRPPK